MTSCGTNIDSCTEQRCYNSSTQSFGCHPFATVGGEKREGAKERKRERERRREQREREREKERKKEREREREREREKYILILFITF